MIWLRSTERFNDMAELERASGAYRISDTEALGARAPAQIDGAFSILSGTFCALYRAEGRAFFRIGADEFELDADTVVRVSGPPTARWVVVEKQGRVVGAHDYVVRTDNQFEDDPTPFIEREDFDFGLFAANVSQSTARKNVLLGRD